MKTKTYEWYNVIVLEKDGGYTVVTPEMVEGYATDEPHTGFEEFMDAWSMRISYCVQNQISMRDQNKVTIVRETREALTEDEVLVLVNQPTQTICCDDCGEEYDRHIGDDCPRCGCNNHDQYEEKYG